MSSQNQPADHLAGATFAVVLAGGNGTRLGELTRWQCKPALTFAGQYRNIDFTLSNCVHSGVRRIAVLTQYKAQSLITHLARGWDLNRRLGEFVDIWPAQQRLHQGWYAGTADAVHQNLDLLLAQRSRYTLVLAGDHIYKMDYRRLLQAHADSGADVTVACVPVPASEASAYGVLGVDRQQRVRSFIEKPQPGTLVTERPVLASMGVYVFNTAYLAERLRRDAAQSESAHDFGRDILPLAVREHHVGAYPFTDAAGRPAYWRDVGTLEGYWQAHMDLLSAEPPLDLHDVDWPVLTSSELHPPAKVLNNLQRHAGAVNSLLAGGVVVRDATVIHSVLSSNVRIACDSIIEEAVILPGARIGSSCRLRRVIVDSDMSIADGTIAGYGQSSIQSTAGGRITLLSRDCEYLGSGAAAADQTLRSVA